MRRNREPWWAPVAPVLPIVGLVLLVLAGGLASDPAVAGTLEANKDLVRRFTDEVYNQSQPERIDAYVHPDFVDHSVGVPEGARGVAWVQQQYQGTYGTGRARQGQGPWRMRITTLFMEAA